MYKQINFLCNKNIYCVGKVKGFLVLNLTVRVETFELQSVNLMYVSLDLLTGFGVGVLVKAVRPALPSHRIVDGRAKTPSCLHL